jgi:hypothetical protein
VAPERSPLTTVDRVFTTHFNEVVLRAGIALMTGACDKRVVAISNRDDDRTDWAFGIKCDKPRGWCHS